jgi:Polyketide cyclase / dehydrase and lipid transport
VIPMPRIEFQLDTSIPPDGVLAAITDFTDRRPDIWPGLDRTSYRVEALGDTWADVREGSGGLIWVDEHYDWSQPGSVTWTARDSGFCRAGGMVRADLDPLPGDGTRVRVTWDGTGKNPAIQALLGITAALGRMPMRGSWEAALRRLERSESVDPRG